MKVGGLMLRVISYRGDALLSRAVCTTVEPLICFNAMSYDLATTMLADWRQLLNGTFETVKCVSLISHDDIKRQVILVAT